MMRTCTELPPAPDAVGAVSNVQGFYQRARAPIASGSARPPTSAGEALLDWLIVGGGPQGVHLAVKLLGECGIAPSRLRVLDPADQLLSRWRACTATTGMSFLRSPAVHHLDLDAWSLMRFAGKPRARRRGPRLTHP